MEIIRKYLQVSAFLILFGLLIIVKNYIGHDDEEASIAVGLPNLQTPTVKEPPASTVPASSRPSETPFATAIPTKAPNNGIYKDGTFTGSVEDAYYGNIQVQAVIQNGRIADVIFLQYPNDNRTSIRINTQSNAYLKEEAIAAQSANVNIISGASDSSFAFRKSMATALLRAHK
jgi:uncharacterized protein with FMN-binding domain